MKSIVIILFVILSSLNTIAQNGIGESPTELLLKSSLHGDFREIKKAIALGADVNVKNANGDTPLNMVAKLSYYFIAKYFIDNGANVNVSNNDKISPLHFAVEYNNVKMVDLFLKNGADINARDNINETPLHWTGWTGNLESAILLLKYGANPYLGNNSGTTPLDLSIRQEHKAVEKLFRKKKYYKFKKIK